MANTKPGEPKQFQSLRERAEAMLRTSRTDLAGMSTQDVAALVYELQVHQMELEIQNEELRHAQMELAESRDRYSDLYEFAPVGYLALDKHGKVLESNLAAATLLGVERQNLLARRITDFIARDGQDAFHVHKQAVNASLQKQVTELAMRHADGTPMTVRLETIRQNRFGDQEPVWRTALIDMTARRLAEDELRRVNRELDQRVADRTSELMQTIGDLQEEISGRRLAEVSLREEREFSVGLINTAQAVILVLDLQGRIVMFNRFAEEMTGYRLDDVKGESWIDLMVPLREQERIKAVLNQANRGTRTRGNINPIVAKDGREILVEWHDAPLLDETGQQVALLSVGLDVTARVSAERENQLLAKAMANLTEGVLITSDQLDWPGPTIIFVNEALCRITGYTAAELLGQTPRVLQGEKTDRGALERLKQALATHKTFEFDTVNYRKDGTPYDAEVHITPLFDGNGIRTNFIAIHRDATERNRNISLLRTSEERLRAVLNTAVDAIIGINQAGVITDVNPATERMFGYSRDEMLGQNVKMLMPPPFREEHDQYLANYHRTGKARIIGIGREVIARRKDGSTFPIDLAVSRVDHLGLYTGIVRDISERKKLEQYLADARIDEQRHLSQELHDGLGGLMTGISMLAKMHHLKLQRAGSALADEAAELLQHVRDAHDQLRRFSRGILPVEVVPRGLQVALRELAALTSKADQFICEFKCEGDVEISSPDHATHLYRIAQEAVSNAIRHGRATCITIALAAKDHLVTLVIRDNGVGIQASPDSQGGMGLRTMIYRAKQIGAALRIEPSREGGTVVSCVYRDERKT